MESRGHWALGPGTYRCGARLNLRLCINCVLYVWVRWGRQGFSSYSQVGPRALSHLQGMRGQLDVCEKSPMAVGTVCPPGKHNLEHNTSLDFPGCKIRARLGHYHKCLRHREIRVPHPFGLRKVANSDNKLEAISSRPAPVYLGICPACFVSTLLLIPIVYVCCGRVGEHRSCLG